MTKKNQTGAKHTASDQCESTINEIITKSDRCGYQIRYTPEVGAEICLRLSEGESLIRITRDTHMPNKSSVLRWVLFCDDENVHKDEILRQKLCQFRDYYQYARIMQAENFMDECTDISDDGTNDWEEKTSKSGTVHECVNHEVVNRSKLRVETRKWLAEVYLPKVQALRNRNIDLTAKQGVTLIFDKQDEDA